MVINCFAHFIHNLLTICKLQKSTISFKFGLYLLLLDNMYINTSHVY
jgi:hypothetical protein